jgi:hypothetical protein
MSQASIFFKLPGAIFSASIFPVNIPMMAPIENLSSKGHSIPTEEWLAANPTAELMVIINSVVPIATFRRYYRIRFKEIHQHWYCKDRAPGTN